jgi:hypothetical protein
LIFYILSQLLEDKEGAAAKVALDLQERESLFDSEIYCGITGRYKNWLNLKTFVDHLTPSKEPRENLIDWNDGRCRSKGWLQKQMENDKNDVETPVEVLAMYFNCIKDTFPTDWNKGRNGFFQSNPGIAVSQLQKPGRSSVEKVRFLQISQKTEPSKNQQKTTCLGDRRVATGQE